MSEYKEQVALVQWLQAKKIFYFAIMNENIQSFKDKNLAIRIGVKHKKAGRVRGTSDIVVMLDKKILFIELKRARRVLKNGKLSSAKANVSDEQISFLKSINEFDYAKGKVCYGCKEAIEFIEENLQ